MATNAQMWEVPVLSIFTHDRRQYMRLPEGLRQSERTGDYHDVNAVRLGRGKDRGETLYIGLSEGVSIPEIKHQGRARKRLPWQKCQKGGGEEIIYKGQWFFRNLSNVNGIISVYTRRWATDYKEGYVGWFYDFLTADNAVKKYKPTSQTWTQFTEWQQCTLGHCRRVTLRINGSKRLYYASYSSIQKKVLVFVSHKSRRVIGTLPKTMMLKELREISQDA